MKSQKLAPALSIAVDDFNQRGRDALRDRSGSLAVTRLDQPRRAPRVVVFVECDAGATFDHLAGAGVDVNQGDGRVRTAIVTLDSLDRLSEEPTVRRITPASRLRLHMDVAAAAAGVVAFRGGADVSGKGVLVGIVDTGIESTHSAFAGRILRVWDQCLAGPGIAEGAYGLELAGDLQTTSEDTVGHGTHVAGVAASADPNFTGAAPEADLVIVKTDLVDAHVADGLRYLFRVATELGRPMVANLSLGGQADGHDGSDPLSSIIDELSGPGRIVCCSAGNEGNDNIHAQLILTAGARHTVAFSPAPVANPAQFTGWYGSSDEVAVAVVTPSGEQTPFQPVISDGSPARTYELAAGTVRVATPGPDPVNGDHNFSVEIVAAGGSAPAAASAGAWRLRLRGDRIAGGRVDLWSVDGKVAQFTGKAVRDSTKIGAPGASSKAMTVASYTTRMEWYDILGGAHQAGLELNDITDFTSEGPRRDDAEKPDVAAPGAMVVSALSAKAPVPLEELIDDQNTIKGGTSTAAAFVTGLVALLLQRQPTLDADAAKKLLRDRAVVPGRPAGTFDPKWGYGLISANGL